MDNIEVQELRKIISNINLIDIRDKEIFDLGHIRNAKNIPMSELLNNYKELLHEHERYYIYCNSGINSKKVCTILNNKGIDVINVNGGYNEWKEKH